MKISSVTTLALVAVATALPVVKKDDQIGELVGQIENLAGDATGNLDGNLSDILSGLVNTLTKLVGVSTGSN